VSSSSDPASGATARPLTHLGRALAFASADRNSVVLIVAITVVVGAVSAIDPLVIKSIVDGIVAHGGTAGLCARVATLLALHLIREGLVALSTALTWRTRLRVQHRILDATVERLHALSAAYHQKEPVGSTMARLDRGVQGLVGAF